MLHKLALRMGRTVGELSAVLTTDELARWFAFDRSSPIGDERMDYLFARLCLLVCEVGGAKPRHGGRMRLEDFLLFKPPEALAAPEPALQAMSRWFPNRIPKKGKR